MARIGPNVGTPMPAALVTLIDNSGPRSTVAADVISTKRRSSPSDASAS
jgi:hypothetical protein